MSLKYVFMRFRPFQSGTVGLSESKDCKVTSCQSWRFEKTSTTQPESNHTRPAQVRVLDDGIILKVGRSITLKIFDLQGHTVPLWKDLNLLKVILQFTILVAFLRQVCSFKVTPFKLGLFLGASYSFWETVYCKYKDMSFLVFV